MKSQTLPQKTGGPDEPMVTCRGCIHLDLADSQDCVGWCKFYGQYRGIKTSRECEDAIFDFDAALTRLAAYIREHAVPPFSH
ncbi:MAG: hypothetical protein PHX38_09680 [Sulfuricella sp.]|nr:hypothetical protein [Sulfuricella sp.]